MNTHRWNNFQIAAFACWGIGAICILWPAYNLYALWREGEDLGGTDRYIVSMLVGIVLLATGGTLHKIGLSREKKP